ncbi:protein transport protein SEC31 homolog B isoform X2 [Beta vulgaris subsp. vulgaris]|uniref:protein transport protein SEC31 homolog B isoform X2 n=1 Tax=Beta vulgaris subsp. vulgaris TaxID=3555 RepID=UPI0020374B9C|nr:protein transport protein SEC31 homolog B isoform X2 [Beta vulgaris subsp. vulgaris]
MACLKSVNRSALVAMSPDSPFFAAGTMAGAVDLSFSTSAELEIYKLDFQSDDHELPMVAQAHSSERFNRLSWGRHGSNSEEFSMGLIAGGRIDGSIGVWNPLPLICPESSVKADVTQLEQHRGPVRGLDFNAFTPYLLASGAEDGEICVWDLASPNEPRHKFPARNTGSATQGEISYLSWNRKVSNILASTSYNGLTVVWDLKKQKSVISFSSDSSRRRCSVLQWHPEVATQLAVASDDDSSPSLKLWDMRNIMSPVRELVGHTKGVISMAWCPSDSSYLLTCAKDNRTICWDTVSGEMVCELPAGTNWNFDVHWYPKIPGVISASSFDGKIGLYNIEACSHYGVAETDFGAAPLRAPKWYRRPVGVSFGFGGKLVSFHSKAAAGRASEVFIHSVVTEDGLVSRSSEFEAAIQNGERSSLRVLCERKSQESESEDDRETWGFLKVMFEDDGLARSKLLAHLGFSAPEELKETVQDELSQQVNALGIEDNGADKAGSVAETEVASFPADNGEDFFNNLPSPKADTPVSSASNNFVGEAVPSEEQRQAESDGPEESADPEFDDAVQRALVVGDYKEAVALCVSSNKMADALVIAHVGGASLWESTRDQYLKMSRLPYLKVVSAIVNQDLVSLVNTRPLRSWKETLALLCTFAQGEKWTVLCDALASRLLAAGYTLAATNCYVCAGNIDKTVEIWSHCLSAETEGKPYVDRLQDLMEKTIVFALATGQKQFSSFLCKLVEKYAEILASQGQLSTAMEFLKLLGDDISPELVILRERIALSSQADKEAEKAMTYENSSVSSASAYGADHGNYGADNSQSYYQDTAAAHVQSGAGPSQYGGNYQQNFTYDRSYAAPAPYQSTAPAPYQSTAPAPYQSTAPTPYQSTAPQQLFVPSQSQQPPQPNFPPPPVSAQPAVRPFVPTPAPVLRNAEQYQQPPTLGSQLYPGSTNPSYQSGPPGPGSLGTIPPQTGSAYGQRMPQVVAPTPTPRGFMPVNSPGGVSQRPGMVSTQPSSPTQSAPAQTAVAPAAPPPTVQTVDTSNVPAHQKPVIATLTRLFNETSEAVGGARANAAKKREIEDNSKKFGALFAKLNTGDISKNAADKLVQLCQALDNGDYSTALQIQVLLTTSEWDECSFWLGNLKRMIKARQNVRL